ncbi:NACHT domain-containing protein [Streptomyces alboflavus]|uniref:NACHT domain-containing protein n=1 Tax=Streptomyces alboflavus TaxID=67267 RepID=UPI0006919D94|nr:ATP-binding protein [Streptomyces alboflavus]
MAALDRALGGALNLATGGLSGGVLGMFDARGRVLGLGRDAWRGLGERLGNADGRVERAAVLEAAHTVIVVLAFFDALENVELPFSLDEVALTRREQMLLAGGRFPSGDGFTQDAAQVDAPRPAPHLPYERHVGELHAWYEHLAMRMADFLRGLAVWEGLDEADREEAARTLHVAVPGIAVRIYESLYARLALEAPEFGFWSGQMEHQATRAELRRALVGLEQALAESADLRHRPVDVAGALARAHQSALGQRILDAQEAPEGILVPTLAQAYLDPDFRVRAVDGQGSPADEEWWARAPVRQDLTEYLAGALTSEGLTTAPLLVLGQPGAGKSVLMRILAARLPAAGFLPVRVALRDVRADDEVQDQIEQAIREATGERATWPDLVRSAGTAVPVVLLDGFDELLQTTGVHQNDFLVRVARFQEREAEQGRPVLAVVTSRTAVADRARYPQGTVALRLEPFQQAHIQLWIEQWNLTNAMNFQAMGLPPLTWDAVAPHRALAGQPLLLTMLALYQAAGNDLRGEDDRPLDEADLYEALLGSFARREVTKDSRISDDEVERRVEEELEQLSLVAFAILNRRRQWVSTAELDEDLAALVGRAPTQPSGLRAPLGQAEAAFGRFFFVQRAQSIRDGRTLSTYEFLHATFGEYLAVRLAVRLVSGLLDHRPVLSTGREPLNDDLMFALLSFAPLFSRQMLRFARARVERLPDAERAALGPLVVRAMGERELRAEQPYPTYLPRRIRVASRHGIYSANLVVLALLLTGGTTAGALFPSGGDAGSSWHRHALLWRSALNEAEWTDLAVSLRLRRTRQGRERDIEVAVQRGELEAPDQVDAYWLYRAPWEEGHTVWHRTYWNEIWHKMDVSAGTNDGVVLQALRPLFESLGPLVTTFSGDRTRLATSTAHDVLRLWLTGESELTVEEIVELYGRIGAALPVLASSDAVTRRLVPILKALLDRDLPRLGPDETMSVLLQLLADPAGVFAVRISDHLRTRHPQLRNGLVHRFDGS